jgi:hypothetical protein
MVSGVLSWFSSLPARDFQGGSFRLTITASAAAAAAQLYNIAIIRQYRKERITRTVVVAACSLVL